MNRKRLFTAGMLCAMALAAFVLPLAKGDATDEIKRLAALMQWKPGAVVADIGAGDGLWTFAAAHTDRIQTGALLLVVRKDFWRYPTRVSHVGFVMESHGRKILRHASRNPYGRVVDEPLTHFFERNARYDKRPVAGFALFDVRAPADRIASLGAPVAPK